MAQVALNSQSPCWYGEVVGASPTLGSMGLVPEILGRMDWREAGKQDFIKAVKDPDHWDWYWRPPARPVTHQEDCFCDYCAYEEGWINGQET